MVEVWLGNFVAGRRNEIPEVHADDFMRLSTGQVEIRLISHDNPLVQRDQTRGCAKRKEAGHERLKCRRQRVDGVVAVGFQRKVANKKMWLRPPVVQGRRDFR